jgi:subtilase family serine protease
MPRLASAGVILVGALALGLATWLAVPPAATASQAARANRGAKADSASRGTVVIGLRRRQAKLSAFAQARATPGSGSYRDYGSVRSLAHQYGANKHTWRRVRRYLRGKGIRNPRLNVTRGFATAHLSQRQRRSAFPPPRRLRRLIGPALFTPRSGQHSRSVAPGRDHAGGRSAIPQRTGTPAGCKQGVDSGGLTPNQYRTAYGVDGLHARGLFGQGTRIAFVEFDGFSQAALNQFAGCFDFVAAHPRVHTVGLSRELAPGDETPLDTEIAAAIAPMARMDIYESQEAPANLVRLFARPLNPGKTGREPPNVISASLGFCESQFRRPVVRLVDYVLATAAGAGVTVVDAAGDSGSSACFTKRRTVAYPASSIFATSVGGTRLTLTRGNRIHSEVVWNDFAFNSPRAGGGGTSDLIHRPAYQRAVGGGSSFRLVPDVAFHSSGFPGYAIRSGGKWHPVDGTSAAAPLLGGGALLAAQAAAAAGVKPPGLLNPLLYQAGGHDSLSLFRDVTRGNNDLFHVGCCTAGPGYDQASGWGSLDLGALARLVVAAGR